MLQSMTISAPIPVPGTQQEPTMPSLGSTTSSTTIIHISGAGGNNNGSELHNNNSNGGARIKTIGTSTGVSVAGGNGNTALHHNSSGSNGSSSNHNRDSSKEKDSNNPGVSRFPSIGNTKKLHLENSTLRFKIAELERYLQGLKEELILAHRQIHTKNLEAKVSQERKAVEIHELGQHIQRCEFDLLAKTAECEALQNKLQYQTKESVSKLKHINMLETEIMDYRRMSIMSAHGPSAAGGTSATGTGASVGPGGMVARGGSVLFRNSRNSSDLSESVRSSTVLQDSAAATEEEASAAAVGALQAQVNQLKDEHWKKDEQIQELTEKIQFLTDSVAQLEKTATATAAPDASAPSAATLEDYTADMTKATSTTDKNTIVSGSTSDASFNTATTGGVSSSGGSSSSIVVNSIGYDLSVEHPKLLSRYQALRSQHAQASEYLGQLESENQDLKVQLLDVSSSSSLEVTPLTVENPEPISISTEEKVEEVEEVEQEEEEEEEAITPAATTATPIDTAAATAAAAAVIPSISRNSLHHPAASGLTPLDTVAANANEFISTSTSSSSVSSFSGTSNTGTVEGLSPISPPTSSSSPSMATAAPALTRKSSLRYSRDGQSSPISAATTSATAADITTSNSP